MGYSTDFTGELKFTRELIASQLAAIKKMLGEDCREHPEWGAKDLYYVDLELTDDFSGLKWSGAEKTYHMERIVQLVIDEMRKKWPDFGLSGQLNAQGEDVEDRWTLAIKADGNATKIKVPLVGQRIECPSCGKRFIAEGKSA